MPFYILLITFQIEYCVTLYLKGCA